MGVAYEEGGREGPDARGVADGTSLGQRRVARRDSSRALRMSSRALAWIIWSLNVPLLSADRVVRNADARVDGVYPKRRFAGTCAAHEGEDPRRRETW